MEAREFPDVVEVVVEILEAAVTSTSTTSSRRLPPRPRPRIGGPLQLRLRLHHGDPVRRRRPHDALLLIDEPTFPGCPSGRPSPSAASRCAHEKGFDFKVLCVAVGDPHQGPTSSSSTRSGRTGSSRSSTSSRRTSCSRPRTPRSSDGATRVGPTRSSPPTEATFVKEGKARKSGEASFAGLGADPARPSEDRDGSAHRRVFVAVHCQNSPRRDRGARNHGPGKGRSERPRRPLGPPRWPPPDAPVHRTGRGIDDREARRGGRCRCCPDGVV